MENCTFLLCNDPFRENKSVFLSLNVYDFPMNVKFIGNLKFLNIINDMGEMSIVDNDSSNIRRNNGFLQFLLMMNSNLEDKNKNENGT